MKSKYHNQLIYIIILIFLGTIHLKSQENCTLGDMNFIRQSQLDSFIIQYPYCKQVDNIQIYGPDINNIHALQNLNFISQLTIANTNIHSLKGLDSLRRSDKIVINNNDQLQDLKILSHLHFTKAITIINNDALVTFEGLLGDSLMTIYIVGNSKITNLKGLSSSFCKNLVIIDSNFENLIGHQLDNLKFLYLSNINSIDSISFINLDIIIIHLSPKLNSISALNKLSNLSSLELEANNNLFDCSIDLICKNLDNPNFKLILELNAIGCNSKEEIRQKCVSAIKTEPIDNQFEIYPQPAIDELYIKGLSDKSVYSISNLEGKIVQNGQTDGFIDVSNLSFGFYVMKLFCENRNIVGKTYKIIKM